MMEIVLLVSIKSKKFENDLKLIKYCKQLLQSVIVTTFILP